ncbi:MAG TPA: glutamate-cysteine ligase family protein [Candidatus Paceibacterota bacterium]
MFQEKFTFKPEFAGLVGVEREQFILNGGGAISPMAPQLLEQLAGDSRFGYELSACQVETRVGPLSLSSLPLALAVAHDALTAKGAALGLSFSDSPVAPKDMPLDVYPDPTGRYQRIVANLPQEVLEAACRVIGTHVHVGMPNLEEAVAAHDRAANFLDELLAIGNRSNGARLALYRVMAKNWRPPIYGSVDAFEKTAAEQGFVENPRDCWHLIRISIHGTLEFRMFDGTGDLADICSWAAKAREAALG